MFWTKCLEGPGAGCSAGENGQKMYAAPMAFFRGQRKLVINQQLYRQYVLCQWKGGWY